jgi:hypothetical protein
MLNGVFKLREEKVFKAIQWNKPGDHPKVKVNEGFAYGTITTKDGIKVVQPGNIILQEASGKYKIFQEKEFFKIYQPILH